MTEAVEIGAGFHPVGSEILELVESYHIGKLKRYKRGNVLYWQGDPVERVFVVKKGAIKVFSISREGKAYTYDILGVGRLVGAMAYLLGAEHEAMAEALEDTDVLVIPPAEFERLLVSAPFFSVAVMRELAHEVRSLSGKMRDHGFLDVQQRLKHSLMRLADEHGVVTENGVKIDLDITHEEIGQLVAANRVTITTCLNKLKKEGYLWKEGRRLVIIPPEHMKILDSLSQSVIEGDDREAIHWARKAVAERVDPIKALDALTGSMRQIDRSFARDEIDLPDVVLAAVAMKAALPIVESQVQRTGQKIETLSTVVIGTVFGDIHDIGKTMVSMFLKARGFRVIDLGVNVTIEQFVKAVRERRPGILAMSALTSVTAPEQASVIQALKAEGLRDRVRIMVGGGAITQELAEHIGADGYEPSARGAVELAWRLSAWH